MLEKDAHRLVWEKFIKGDEHALLEVYQQHYLGLINYGRSIVKERGYVNDCLVEMLLRLWDKKSSLPIVDNVRSYLMTTLRRTIFDRLASDKKREIKQIESQGQLEDYELPYEEYLLKIQSDQRLKARIEIALKKLTARQLELVRMKFFEDLGYDEISDRCGITKRTAYNIIHDAIITLKEELGGEEHGSFMINLSIVLAVLTAAPSMEKIF